MSGPGRLRGFDSGGRELSMPLTIQGLGSVRGGLPAGAAR